MTKACRYCHWSSSVAVVYFKGVKIEMGPGDGSLWCTLLHRNAVEPCDKWEREPGSDDE